MMGARCLIADGFQGLLSRAEQEGKFWQFCRQVWNPWDPGSLPVPGALGTPHGWSSSG